MSSAQLGAASNKNSLQVQSQFSTQEDSGPVLSSQSNNEEILKEVCLNNGINYNKLESEGCQQEVLEMFFSGFPRLTGLHHFPNIHTLTVIGQSISALVGLTSLSKLKELWVAECQIKKIEGLEKCTQLEKLYLYGNLIGYIENLSMLKEIKIVWLNCNNIKTIENLERLGKLEELNLAENNIDKIGHSLDSNTALQEVNLSGNPISSLRDLTNLVRLPQLRSISMKDPLFRPCPVSQLCNYSTHLLFHMPHLQRLDSMDVSLKQLNELAFNTVMKKKMYYNMRVKTLRRNMSHLLSCLEQYKTMRLLAVPHRQLRNFTFAMKEIEKEIQKGQAENPPDVHDSDPESERDVHKNNKNAIAADYQMKLDAKLEALKIRKYFWERKCSEVDDCHDEAVLRIQRSADQMVNRLLVELETGGNVRFEEGTSADAWFSSCHDLVMSRFCSSDYKAHGIVAIKIHRIIRIHNRILRARFDKKLIKVTEGSQGEYYPGTKNSAYKKLLEYLFWIWDPEITGGAMEPSRIPEEGFMDAETYQMLEREAAVPLSNSLSLADRHRITSLLQRNQSVTDICPFRFGQMIIAKTYLGKSTGAVDGRPTTSSAYPSINAVYKPRKRCVPPPESPQSECECTARQCEWYIFDHELVLPEYIIEFEYVTKEPAWSPYSQLLYDVGENKVLELPSPPKDAEDPDDEQALTMPPIISKQPRLISLTDEQLLRISRAGSLMNICQLNLHGHGLSRLKPLQNLVLLKRLVVSFNDLSRLDDLAGMDLQFLDASYNKIFTLEGMRSMSSLEVLDVSWNNLQKTREELSTLRKHCTMLRHLHIRHNPWLKPSTLRLRVIGRIKTLKWLDGELVLEQESQKAQRLAAGSRISQLSLLTNSRTDDKLPRSLSLDCSAHAIMLISRNKPCRTFESDTSWLSLVTTLNLDNQHISKISNLERLENLRWASFDNNHLTKIEGLENCVKLEELSLEMNCILHLEGLNNLSCLRWLNLAHNQLASLDTGVLAHLPHLVYLALDNNKLTSLAGIQEAQGLIQLYIGNNSLNNIRDIFLLKQLQHLVILDMFGNPMATHTDNYRLFVVYHLKVLKALDGNAVEAVEGSMAKEVFGGRLTLDLVAEKMGSSSFQEFRELDLPNNTIRVVDINSDNPFQNLRSVNLEHNNLTSLSGLTNLVNLKVLCLNNNHIECVVPRPKVLPNSRTRSLATLSSKIPVEYFPETFRPLLQHLEVLHLGYNGIKDMATLQLGRLPSLKALFLQGNEISKVEGLEVLHELRELVLDRNKIKALGEGTLSGQWNLQELHLEENRLKELGPLCVLPKLQRLYLGANRIQDFSEIEKLDLLSNLIELSVVNNAVSRRMMHRVLLVFRMPQLAIIDGIPVTDEERAKAEVYMADQISVMNSMEGGGSLPGIVPMPQYKSSVPMKVTNVQLSSPASWGSGGGFYEETESMQRGAGRRRAPRNADASRLGASVYGNAGPQSLYNGSSNRSSQGPSSHGYPLYQDNPQDYLDSMTRLNHLRSGR